ncbi:MAG: peptide chain release factor N(5)-glutamine methyltransferase [Bacilli bacterium]|nr:peptide chain release factor N(5)-glutamine methyltransferase [Bacilli bacterium]
MPTLREKFFESKKIKKDHVSESDLRDLLISINRLKSYTDLTVHFDDDIMDEIKYDDLFNRLQNGEMLQYLLNEASFLGDKYYVTNDVLIPRQETEQLVSLTIDYIKYNFEKQDLTIVDLCTGSGILAITLAREFRKSRVFATDISEKAIEVAKKNNDKFNTNIDYFLGDFIEPILDKNIKSDVLICNPPYIENIEGIDKRTREQEPHLALLAKPGTKFYEIVIKNIDRLMNEHFLIAFEIGEDQVDRLTEVLEDNNLSECYRFQNDIYGKPRFLFIMK